MKQLTDLGELTLGSRLKKISDNLFEDVDSAYKRNGVELSSRCFPILFLLNANGDSGITQLAEQLGQAHSSVSQMSKKLLAAGYVVNKPDKEDDRRRLLALTAKGLALFEQMTPIWNDIEQSIKEMIGETEFELMQALIAFEQRQQELPLAQRLSQKQRLRESNEVEIIDFDCQYRDHFKRLNIEWLEKYFYVEAIDNQVLSDPETSIINPGGHIFFARYKDEIVGTGALIKIDDNTFELTKMAVTDKYQGLKIGRKIAERAIQTFERSDAQVLFLESNHRLKPALHLYQTLGFEFQPQKKDSHYQRADVYMIYNPSKQEKHL